MCRIFSFFFFLTLFTLFLIHILDLAYAMLRLELLLISFFSQRINWRNIRSKFLRICFISFVFAFNPLSSLRNSSIIMVLSPCLLSKIFHTFLYGSPSLGNSPISSLLFQGTIWDIWVYPLDQDFCFQWSIENYLKRDLTPYWPIEFHHLQLRQLYYCLKFLQLLFCIFTVTLFT